MSMADEMREEMELKLSDTLPLGKYKGKTVLDVLEMDWEYLCWLRDNEMSEFSFAINEILTLKEKEQKDEFEPQPDDLPWMQG